MPLPRNVRLRTLCVNRLGRVKSGTERGNRGRRGRATGGSRGGGVSLRNRELQDETYKTLPVAAVLASHEILL